MEEKLRIVATGKDIPVMGNDGNVVYKTSIQKYHLVNFQGDPYSQDYFNMEHLKGDYYVVVEAASRQVSMVFSDELDDTLLEYKYGLISLRRDSDNKVIPMAEELVVPIIYDDISDNNLDTITVRVNDHFTYVELSKNSPHYGQQLVPAVLDRAVPFSTSYDGYAECELNGITGFIPRNIIPMKTISPVKLLSEEQVAHLISINTALHTSSIEKLYNLTGTTVLSLTRGLKK